MPSAIHAPGGAASVTDALRAAYNRTLYVGRPCATAHPARLRAVARLMGVAAAPVERARILDVGCGDGGNLLPIAAAWPGTDCVGIDLAEQGIERANRSARELGLRNVRFLACDLRDLPGDLAAFDYIVAHGFYSWVPPDVRELLLDTLRARMAPDGIAFVSHNTLPGCKLRELAWSIIRPAVAGIDDPATAVARTREVGRTMADAMSRQPGLPSALAAEFGDLVTRPDYALVHDDLAPVNTPVYLRDLAAQGARFGLAWLGDADLFRHIAPAFGDAANAWIATLPPLEREHVVDHIRMRRFRESLFRHAGRPAGTPAAADRLAGLHVAAVNDMVERHGQSRPPAAGDRSPQAVRWHLLDQLVRAHPAALPVDGLVDAIVALSGAGGAFAARADAQALILRAALSGVAVLFDEPPRLTTAPGERPRAFAVARWQAAHRDFVTNLRHEPVALNDDAQRALLARLDGTRTRAEAAAGLAGATGSIDDYLGHFAALGLLEA